MSWNVAWEYISEILRDPSSHLKSAMQGDLYVPHPAERAAWATLEYSENAHRGPGKGMRAIKRPWAGKRPTYTSTPTTVDAVDPERAERRSKLDAMF
ncbi:MAG: hypothetical protein ABWY57_16020 [Mycetocola sp.]